MTVRLFTPTFFCSIAFVVAQDAPRQSAEDTVKLRGKHDVNTMDNAGLTLFWLFIGLTATSVMCSVLVICLRHCIRRCMDRPSTSADQAEFSSPPTELHAATHQQTQEAAKTTNDEGCDPAFLEAVGVQQPGGSVVVGVPVVQR